MVAAQFVRLITTIVSKVAQLPAVDTLLVGTLELVIEIAHTRSLRTQRHIILVTAVTAIINAIADLVACNAPMIGTLEASQRVTIEVRTHLGRFVRIVATVIGAVANVRHGHTQMIVALES